MKKMLLKVGYSAKEAEGKKYEYEILRWWEPITVNQLMRMDKSDLKEVLSFCWHNGEVRCHATGIQNLTIGLVKHGDRNSFDIRWGDDNGDPHVIADYLDTEIYKIGDGEWNYGLFKKI